MTQATESAITQSTTDHECMTVDVVSGEVCSFRLWHDGRHSWQKPAAALRVSATIEAVNRSTKNGLEVKFAFGKVTSGDIKRLVDLVGEMVVLTITPESEQPKLPLD